MISCQRSISENGRSFATLLELGGVKKNGDPCGGFIRVNEDTKRFSRL